MNIAGGRTNGTTAPAPRSDKGGKRIKRNPKSVAVDSLREQIAACERLITAARDAEATIKVLKAALTALEGK